MEILLEPEKWVLDKYSDIKSVSEYKLSDYIIQVKYNNEILLLHTITWAIYILTEHEFKDILNNSILKQNKVVISNNIDELKVAHDVYL